MAKVIYIAPLPTQYEIESERAAQIGRQRRDAAEAAAQTDEGDTAQHVAELAIGGALGDETPEATEGDESAAVANSPDVLDKG